MSYYRSLFKHKHLDENHTNSLHNPTTRFEKLQWLENQAEARKFTQLPDELADLSANETSLEWLKAKAGEFYAQGNYQSAVGAYTHAIRLFAKVPALYSNRAACHYKLRNLIKVKLSYVSIHMASFFNF